MNLFLQLLRFKGLVLVNGLFLLSIWTEKYVIATATLPIILVYLRQRLEPERLQRLKYCNHMRVTQPIGFQFGGKNKLVRFALQNAFYIH